MIRLNEEAQVHEDLYPQPVLAIGLMDCEADI